MYIKKEDSEAIKNNFRIYLRHNR